MFKFYFLVCFFAIFDQKMEFPVWHAQTWLIKLILVIVLFYTKQNILPSDCNFLTKSRLKLRLKPTHLILPLCDVTKCWIPGLYISPYKQSTLTTDFNHKFWLFHAVKFRQGRFFFGQLRDLKVNNIRLQETGSSLIPRAAINKTCKRDWRWTHLRCQRLAELCVVPLQRRKASPRLTRPSGSISGKAFEGEANKKLSDTCWGRAQPVNSVALRGDLPLPTHTRLMRAILLPAPWIICQYPFGLRSMQPV